MDSLQTVQVLLIVLCGGFLQGTVAFGFGLFGVPLLMMVGLSMPTVLAIIAVCTVVQTASGVHHLRQSVPWKIVGTSLLLRSISMLAGIWVLHRLATYPHSLLNFWVGLTLLLMLILQVAWQPQPKDRLHMGWDLAAFLGSGFSGGLCGMGGPPLLLWVMAHNWSSVRTRAFLFASFMCLVPIQLAVLYWTFGHDVVYGMMLGAAFSPVVLLGSILGLRQGEHLSKPRLKRVVFVLLSLVALNSMAPEIWRLMQR